MAKKTDGWMPLYIADYLADTSRLSTEQHGAYLLLIMDYWRNGPPPNDDVVLASITRLTSAQWKKHAAALAGFFSVDGGVWTHKRIDAERQKASGISAKRTESAKQGAAKRWSKSDGKEMPNGMPNGIANGMPKGMPNAEQSAWQNDAPSPFTNNLIPSLSSQSSTPRAPRGDDDKPNSPAEWIEVFAEQHGVDVDHRSFHDRKKFFPLAKAWTNAGITVGQMRAACAKAQSEAKEPIAWLPAYADRVLATMQAQRQPAAAESFAEREQRMHRENWEQMTGRQWPDAPTASLTSADAVDCIDVESTPARIAQ